MWIHSGPRHSRPQHLGVGKRTEIPSHVRDGSTRCGQDGRGPNGYTSGMDLNSHPLSCISYVSWFPRNFMAFLRRYRRHWPRRTRSQIGSPARRQPLEAVRILSIPEQYTPQCSTGNAVHHGLGCQEKKNRRHTTQGIFF